MTCHKFSKEFISRFVDNDLNEAARNAFIRHKAQCPDCSALEVRFRQTGVIFKQQADAIAGQLLKDTPEILIKINERSHESGRGWRPKRKSQSVQTVFRT